MHLCLSSSLKLVSILHHALQEEHVFDRAIQQSIDATLDHYPTKKNNVKNKTNLLY